MSQGSMIFVLVLAILGLSVAQVPVPSHVPGFVIQNGSESAHVVIDAFYDLLCPDSKANWPILQKVMDHYKDDVRVRLVLFPLPYHHHAFFTAFAAQIFLTHHSSAYEQFVSLIFEHQDELLSGGVNMTQSEVQQHIASIVSSGDIGVTSQQMMMGFKDENLAERAVLEWKYSAGRTINGTPEFAVNGMVVVDASNYSESQWIKFIDGLLHSSSHTMNNMMS
ncbi:uncharacterized protein LOC134183292 [Corticium candelabrum]|uniref:uncharacterized protein LOC134183292 n=1 Tax=Corticium candelabrum TaxID=121492 RepID=UPI002E267281|nr:uncharacterized protein LOC134183292 [Corticium candelabrum]